MRPHTKNCHVAINNPREVAIDAHDDYDDETTEVTSRLPLLLSHPSSSFKFKSFPDSGSCCSVISTDVATNQGLEILPRKSKTIITAVNGQCLNIDGKVLLKASVPNGVECMICFAVCRDFRNK